MKYDKSIVNSGRLKDRASKLAHIDSEESLDNKNDVIKKEAENFAHKIIENFETQIKAGNYGVHTQKRFFGLLREEYACVQDGFKAYWSPGYKNVPDYHYIGDGDFAWNFNTKVQCTLFINSLKKVLEMEGITVRTEFEHIHNKNGNLFVFYELRWSV